MFGANIAYLFLFPFFYFVYLGSAAGIWNTSSYFGSVAIATVAIYVLIFPIPVMRRMSAASGKSALFITLLLWCALWTLWHWYETDKYPAEAYTQIIQMILFWVALFFVGLFVDPSRKQTFRIAGISIAAMIAVSAYFVDAETRMVNLRSVFDTESIPSYQGFANAALLTGLLLLSNLRGRRWRLFWMVVCAALLFVNGARSEFVGFLAATGIVEGISILRKPKAIFSTSVALIPLYFIISDRWSDIENSRQMQLLDFANSTSWIARQDFMQLALDQIAAHPISGVFAGHFEWEWPVSAGAYAHNALSAWVSFGIIGFSLYVLLTLICVKSSLSLLEHAEVSPTFRLSAYVNILSFILIIASKNVFWPVIALGWGLTINSTAKLKEINRHNAARVIPGSVESCPDCAD
ncbi:MULTISPECIES: O-antigen ligase family protein [Mesorhizobium]|uniref:O-antigen ligase domain-containing protein n=1 Tax=Mesorhizobium denitrificans TaxID=2294114 RepID=A0A371XD69_9HYPH|nr:MULTISPECIES: O-antigen ligase family protein [Mesorhizobium]RFC66974.1 O-antigen ligase domain-containing protein [Mesorhizobium denitrificans]